MSIHSDRIIAWMLVNDVKLNSGQLTVAHISMITGSTRLPLWAAHTTSAKWLAVRPIPWTSRISYLVAIEGRKIVGRTEQRSPSLVWHDGIV